MKVLHVSARADFGGGPEHMYQQVLGQVEVHDIKCFLACPDDYPYYDRYLDAVGSENIFLIPHRKFNMLSLLNLIRFVRKNKIEIIHSHGKGAGVYSRLLSVFLGVSCIHTFHGLHVGEYSKISKYLYIGLEHTFSFFTTRIICVSSGELESIVSESIAPREKLVQIDNGVKVPVRVESRSKSSQLKVLAVNRFDDQKNPELLVGIASAIKASSM
jgi:glycosyltransferase involved in cell wall biosynthesis